MNHAFSPQVSVPSVYVEVLNFLYWPLNKLNFLLVVMTFVAMSPQLLAENLSTPLESLTKKELHKSSAPAAQETQVPELDDEDPAYYFPYQESLSIRLGGGINFRELDKEEGEKIPYSLGFEYMFKSETKTHTVAGFDLLSDPKFYLHLGKKIFFVSTEKQRMYYKLALSMRFDEGDQIETPFDWKSYSIVGGIGFEDLIKSTRSVRADLELYVGREDLLALFTIGWSVAF